MKVSEMLWKNEKNFTFLDECIWYGAFECIWVHSLLLQQYLPSAVNLLTNSLKISDLTNRSVF